MRSTRRIRSTPFYTISDLMPLSCTHSGSSNRQPGNHRLRVRAAANRHPYQAMRNSQKATFANEIFQAWRSETAPPGRFLKRVEGLLYEVPDSEAIRTIQVLLCRDSSSPPSRSRPTVPPPRVQHLPEPPMLPPPPPGAPAAAPMPLAPRSRFEEAALPEFMSSKRRSTLRPSWKGVPDSKLSSRTGWTESTASSSSSGRGGRPTDVSTAHGQRRPAARLADRVKSLVQRLFCGILVRSDV